MCEGPGDMLGYDGAHSILHGIWKNRPREFWVKTRSDAELRVIPP